jgi:penicillin-binding protein 2
LELEGDRYRNLTRRALMLGGGQALLMAALIGRMYQLQVLDSDQYQLMAEQNRIDLRLISPLRGRILDRWGEELATNRLSYRISIIQEQTTDTLQTLLRLGQLIPVSDDRIERVLKQSKRSRSFLPVTVAENLTWEEFARVNAKLADLPGVYPDAGQSRFYPHSTDFTLLVGYVGPVTENELLDLPEDPAFLLPEFRMGKRGLERVFNDELRGSPGSRRVEVNALGREIRELNRDDGMAGQDLRLTVDRELQQFAMQRLGEQSASAVVMDIHTGEIVVMASAPGFDGNEFNHGISHENWQGLLADPRNPLLNKAVQGRFPPGSTFKMIVAMAALEQGIISPGHTAHCNGKLPFGDHTFHCWKRGGHGTVDLNGALEQSCDVYFYKLAKRLDVDAIAEMAHRFGLGEITGLEIDGEEPGLVPSREWKRQKFGEKWHTGETLNTSIGQGYLLATPLQLAVMTSRIANGGVGVKPTLRKQDPLLADQLVAQPGDIGVSERALNAAQKGMISVMEGPRGTARRSQLRVDGHRMAGKTGTAQVRRISKREREEGVRKDYEKPWVERDHALFVAYAPIDNPAYAVAIVVEHGGGGSSVAAPIAHDVMAEVLRKDPSNVLVRPADSTGDGTGEGNA